MILLIRQVTLAIALIAAMPGLAVSAERRASAKPDLMATSSIPQSQATVDRGKKGHSRARASIPQRLSLQDAIRRALDYQPSLREAEGEINQQGAAIRDARSGYYPSIGGGLNLGRDNTLVGGYQPAATINASQMIYDFGKTGNSVDAATATRETRRADFNGAVEDIIKDTSEAAVELLRNQSLALVSRDQIKDTQSILELVKARTTEGASSRSDELQAEARVQAAQTTALETAAKEKRWQGTLRSLTGVGGSINLAAAIPASLSKSCSGAAPRWDSIPNVLSARSKKQEAEARLRFAKSDSLPTLSLEAGGSFGLLGESTKPDYVIGLKLTGKLYNGGSYGAKQDGARYAVAAADAAIAAAATDASRSWQESGAQVESTSTLLSSLAIRQQLMSETRDLYQRQFLDLGTRTLLDVLNADQELHQARFDAVNVRFDLYKLNIECASAAGKLRTLFGVAKEPGAPATRSNNIRTAAIEMPAPVAPVQPPPDATDSVPGQISGTTGINGSPAQWSADATVTDPKVISLRFMDVPLRGSI